MNLERMPNEDKLNLCRKYYLGGFALLPFLWLVNVVWFFKEAFMKPVYTEQALLKTCESGGEGGGKQEHNERKKENIASLRESSSPTDVKRSAIGLLFWVAVLTTWITIFQHFRAEWGEVADYLSFTIPLGIP